MEIGPSFPPHLLKKAKCPFIETKDQEIISQKSKMAGVEDDDGDDVFGPTLPPQLTTQNQDIEIDSRLPKDLSQKSKLGVEDDDGDDVYGPILPPQLTKQKRDVAIGPALPKGMDKSKPSLNLVGVQELRNSDEVDTGDIIGPMPSPFSSDLYTENIKKDIETRSNTMKDKLLGKSVIKQKREEWMTELPPEISKNFGIGPRKFRSQAAECGDRSIWTDTPADKARKLSGEGSNKSFKIKDQTSHKAPWEEERERNIEQLITSYNKTKRGESLLEKHQQKIKKQKKEDGKKPDERRPFDRDKDLANPIMDPSKRKSLINKSQELGTRFHHAKSGSSYL